MKVEFYDHPTLRDEKEKPVIYFRHDNELIEAHSVYDGPATEAQKAEYSVAWRAYLNPKPKQRTMAEIEAENAKLRAENRSLEESVRSAKAAADSKAEHRAEDRAAKKA